MYGNTTDIQELWEMYGNTTDINELMRNVRQHNRHSSINEKCTATQQILTN